MNRFPALGIMALIAACDGPAEFAIAPPIGAGGASSQSSSSAVSSASSSASSSGIFQCASAAEYHVMSFLNVARALAQTTCVPNVRAQKRSAPTGAAWGSHATTGNAARAKTTGNHALRLLTVALAYAQAVSARRSFATWA